jgi:(S)-sulfolactate dehydrogenase
MKRVLISEYMDEAAIASLRRSANVQYQPSLFEDRASLLRAVAEMDALIVRNRTRVDREVVEAAPALRVVGRLGVGLDNIDLAACEARGVKVIPATGANALSVAEYVMCTAMVLLRGAYSSTRAVLDGNWPRDALQGGREIAGKTLGIVGYGTIGRTVARLAAGLGMNVIACDPMMEKTDPQRRDLDSLFESSDVVTLHVPLSNATRSLVDAPRLARMKKDAILINTSRGGIVDEAALAGALRAGRLGGAALDVFSEEPLRAGSPLDGVPNLLLTPHVSGLTRESNERVGAMIAAGVAAALAS